MESQPFFTISCTARDQGMVCTARVATHTQAVSEHQNSLKDLRENERVAGVPGTQHPILTGLRLLRIHQWFKNVLLFLPLLLTLENVSKATLAAAVLAFLAFSLGASGIYVLNDWIDLPFDRLHVFKRNRPLASGAVSVPVGFLVATILVTVSLGLGLFLPRAFLFCLLAYFALAISYTLVLKRWYLVDVSVLAALFVLRIQAGSTATGITVSRWTLGFSALFFLSLAFLKRYAELLEGASLLPGSLPGRSYRRTDLPVVRVLGLLSGSLAVIVMGGHFYDPAQTRFYGHPEWLWALGPLTIFWITWVWRKATRREMHHDPLFFLLTDPVSLGTAVLAVLTITGAQL